MGTESAVAMEMGNTSFLWTGCHSSRVESSAIRWTMCLAAVILVQVLLQPKLLLGLRPQFLLLLQSQLLILLRSQLLLGLRLQLLLRYHSHPLPSLPHAPRPLSK